jgi:predicted nucleic acid-binding Zn ribbon protein
MHAKKTCTFCGKPLPKKIYKGTPQAQGFCSDACLLDAAKMEGRSTQ